MNQKVILLVDDEPFILRSLSFILSKEGYKVHVASNGEEALDLLHKIKPDLMFLDVLMPKKHGFEVCQQVKKDPKLKDIYTILLTTKGQESDREIGLRLGADDYITKPFSPTKLIQKVREVLEGDTHG